jgi:hypothetical protein
VIKALRTGEEFWQAKFDHEIRLHQAFTQNPPPVRVSTLVHTDGHRVLVIEHIPCHPVDAERYPEQPLPATTLDAVLDTITTFALWAPPCAGAGVRLPRPRRALPPRGVLRRQRPHRPPCSPRGGWACVAGQSRRPAAGQPVARRAAGACYFEFTGLFLPGFDVAMLHTLLPETPGAQASIEALVDEAGIEVPFLVNQAMVLSRELRLHTELPVGEFRQRRLALLGPEWDAFRQRLHTRR